MKQGNVQKNELLPKRIPSKSGSVPQEAFNSMAVIFQMGNCCKPLGISVS